MKIPRETIRESLKKAGLKITPQRLAILDAVFTLDNHPTAERVSEYVRQTYPDVATGTVYKVLEALVGAGLIRRVKTDRDAMRYDAIQKDHHHLYCAESDRIEDYFDEELDSMLSSYFEKKGIPDFQISEIKVQINGHFNSEKPDK